MIACFLTSTMMVWSLSRHAGNTEIMTTINIVMTRKSIPKRIVIVVLCLKWMCFFTLVFSQIPRVQSHCGRHIFKFLKSTCQMSDSIRRGMTATRINVLAGLQSDTAVCYTGYTSSKSLKSSQSFVFLTIQFPDKIINLTPDLEVALLSIIYTFAITFWTCRARIGLHLVLKQTSAQQKFGVNKNHRR